MLSITGAVMLVNYSDKQINKLAVWDELEKRYELSDRLKFLPDCIRSCIPYESIGPGIHNITVKYNKSVGNYMRGEWIYRDNYNIIIDGSVIIADMDLKFRN